MHNSMKMTALVGFIAAGANAQSVNIDFGDVHGTPAATFGAAGQAGTWNALSGQAGVAQPLVDLEGNETEAQLEIAEVFGPEFDLEFGDDDPATDGAIEQLLDDGILGGGDVMLSMTLSGLEPGTYELIVYGWTPGQPEALTLISIADDFFDFDIIGGSWPGTFEEGVTHSVQTLSAASGSFTLNFAGGIFFADGFINGLQLELIGPVESPSPDIDGDGVIGFSDLLVLLSNWTGSRACDDAGDDCLGDLNSDNKVNFADLLILLAAWGPAA